MIERCCEPPARSHTRRRLDEVGLIAQTRAIRCSAPLFACPRYNRREVDSRPYPLACWLLSRVPARTSPRAPPDTADCQLGQEPIGYLRFPSLSDLRLDGAPMRGHAAVALGAVAFGAIGLPGVAGERPRVRGLTPSTIAASRVLGWLDRPVTAVPPASRPASARHSRPGHRVENGCDVRTSRERLGLLVEIEDVQAIVSTTPVPDRDSPAVRSPLDCTTCSRQPCGVQGISVRGCAAFIVPDGEHSRAILVPPLWRIARTPRNDTRGHSDWRGSRRDGARGSQCLVDKAG